MGASIWLAPTPAVPTRYFVTVASSHLKTQGFFCCSESP